ncbi:MAG: hypothetical protein R3244_07810, partial [Thermoanaerobaculia bacterium]|nr:hypothetical protein [Thermoanaerobaculia bacterium]
MYWPSWMYWRYTVLLVAVLAVPGVGWPEAAVGAGEPLECTHEIPPSRDFAETVRISHPAATAFMPASAERDGTVLLVWQETTRSGARVAYARVRQGCIEPAHWIEDPLPNPRRPAVAATASGWVVAYEVQDPPEPIVRAVELDPSGGVVQGPVTVSEPGRVGSRVRLAAFGDDVVFAWTDVANHWIARRGPVEEFSARQVGTELEAPGLVNFPRVLVDGDGRIYLAYRDGGPERTDYEILVVVREVGEEFGEPLNLSRSSGLMSDDVALWLQDDVDVGLVWVEQDDERAETFEVVHATLSSALEIGEPQRFGSLGMASFKPSVTTGFATVW